MINYRGNFYLFFWCFEVVTLLIPSLGVHVCIVLVSAGLATVVWVSSFEPLRLRGESLGWYQGVAVDSCEGHQCGIHNGLGVDFEGLRF